MRKRISMISAVVAALFVVGVLPAVGQMEEETVSLDDITYDEREYTQEELEAVEEAFKKDSTGTNPLNFTYDARLYNEYQWLNTAGDGDQNITTLELRAPLGDGKWQLRGKIRGQYLAADLTDDGTDDLDASGMGDTDLRFMTIPYLNLQKKLGIATGVEFFLPTATDPTLGTGAWTVAPFVFGGYFNPIGPGSIFVPGFQWKISLDEDPGRDQVNQGIFDFFLVKTFNANQFWAYLDPQVILDFENSAEVMLLELQFGTMLDKILPKPGQSIWIMPSFGVGTDRPYDYSVEVGYKYVWR